MCETLDTQHGHPSDSSYSTSPHGFVHSRPQRRDEQPQQSRIRQQPQIRDPLMVRSNTHHPNFISVPSNSVHFSFSYRPSPSPISPSGSIHSVRNEVPPRYRGPGRSFEIQDPQRRSRGERIRHMEDTFERLGIPPRMHGDDYEELLDSFPIITRGTPRERIAMFPRWDYVPPKAGSEASRNEERTRCNICLEDFCRGDTVLSLPCFHIYHEECIVHWLGEHKTCGICRKDCTEDEGVE